MSLMRPWLALYHPSYRNLLAQRLAEHAADGDDAAATPLPFELWLHIAEQLSDFTAVCRLATVCRVLWPLGRHPSVWERRCREAFCLAGHAPCDRVIRDYAWSWQRMFLLRPRLRFDGVYMSAHTKLLAGLNEGRGMKEKDVDFYARCGKWVTHYRLWRFYDDGTVLALTTSQSPLDVRPAMAAAHPSKPQTLRQRCLKGGCWGTYLATEVRDGNSPAARIEAAAAAAGGAGGDGGGGGSGGGGGGGAGVEERGGDGGGRGHRLLLDALINLVHEDYPSMRPAELRFSFELCSLGGAAAGASSASARVPICVSLCTALPSVLSRRALHPSRVLDRHHALHFSARALLVLGASNASARLVAHSLHNHGADPRHFEVVRPAVFFLAFGAPKAAARDVWLTMAPLGEFSGGGDLNALAAAEAAARAAAMQRGI